MDRFEDLRTFVMVADLSSVSQAARRLDKASSAVSRRLKELEQRLSTQLLTRTTRTIVLTEAGQRFYDRAVRILVELEDAEASVKADVNQLGGTLRLTTPVSFGVKYLAPVITDFMLQNPALKVDIDMTDHKVDLVAAGLDLALRIGKLHDSTLKSRKLVAVNSAVCASPAFWEKHGLPTTPEDLAGLPALCYSNKASPTQLHWLSAKGETGKLRLEPRLLASNGELLCQAAVSGLGVVCEPTFILSEAMQSGKLVPVLQDYTWSDMALHAVYPATQFLPARSRLFIDFLVEQLGGKPVWEQVL